MIVLYNYTVFYRIANLIAKAFEALNPRISYCLGLEKFIDVVCNLELNAKL